MQNRFQISLTCSDSGTSMSSWRVAERQKWGQSWVAQGLLCCGVLGGQSHPRGGGSVGKQLFHFQQLLAALRKACWLHVSFFKKILFLFFIFFPTGLSQDLQYSYVCFAVGPCLSILNVTCLRLLTPNTQSAPLPPTPLHVSLHLFWPSTSTTRCQVLRLPPCSVAWKSLTKPHRSGLAPQSFYPMSRNCKRQGAVSLQWEWVRYTSFCRHGGPEEFHADCASRE